MTAPLDSQGTSTLDGGESEFACMHVTSGRLRLNIPDSRLEAVLTCDICGAELAMLGSQPYVASGTLGHAA